MKLRMPVLLVTAIATVAVSRVVATGTVPRLPGHVVPRTNVEAEQARLLSGRPGFLTTGVLDTFDGERWIGPTQEPDQRVPRSGILDPAREAHVRATLVVPANLPLALPSGVRTVRPLEGRPTLFVNPRTGGIRVGSPGDLRRARLTYRVSFQTPPRQITFDARQGATAWLDVAGARPLRATSELLSRAQEADTDWMGFILVRDEILSRVDSSTYAFSPFVPAGRVDQIIEDVGEAPGQFEALAAVALVARWMGIASRIAVGFDARAATEGHTFRLKDLQQWVELSAKDYGWVPATKPFPLRAGS